MRRIKRARWEAFLAPYRAKADKDSVFVSEYYAHLIVTRPHVARIHRVRLRQDEIADRRHHNDRFYRIGWYGWLRRDYGRKQRRNR